MPRAVDFLPHSGDEYLSNRSHQLRDEAVNVLCSGTRLSVDSSSPDSKTKLPSLDLNNRNSPESGDTNMLRKVDKDNKIEGPTSKEQVLDALHKSGFNDLQIMQMGDKVVDLFSKHGIDMNNLSKLDDPNSPAFRGVTDDFRKYLAASGLDGKIGNLDLNQIDKLRLACSFDGKNPIAERAPYCAGAVAGGILTRVAPFPFNAVFGVVTLVCAYKCLNG